MPADRPSLPAAFPQGLPRRGADHRHGALGRRPGRAGRAGPDRRLDRPAHLQDSVPGTDRRRPGGLRRRPVRPQPHRAHDGPRRRPEPGLRRLARRRGHGRGRRTLRVRGAAGRRPGVGPQGHPAPARPPGGVAGKGRQAEDRLHPAGPHPRTRSQGPRSGRGRPQAGLRHPGQAAPARGPQGRQGSRHGRRGRGLPRPAALQDEGRRYPRGHGEKAPALAHQGDRHPPRRPQHQDRPPHRHRGGRSAPHPRFHAFRPRRDQGALRGHPGLHRRRTKD